MPVIQPVQIETVDADTRERLEAVRAALGVVPNGFTTIANSPAALKGFLAFTAALSEGTLSPEFRTQLSLVVAQGNDCHYCQAAFSAVGSMTGMSSEEIIAARQAQAENAKTDAGLKFALALVVQDGSVSPSAVAKVKAAGYTDGEIIEIIAHVASNTFINYVNLVAETTIDFEPAPSLEAQLVH